MDTQEISQKLRRYLHRYRQGYVSANDLQLLNKTFQRKYDDMTDEQMVYTFMNDEFKPFLKKELTNRNYWVNPQDYLRESAEKGTFSILLFKGYLPWSYETLVRPAIKKHVSSLFRLKNFNNFRLQFEYISNDDFSTQIKLSWSSSSRATTMNYSTPVASEDESIASIFGFEPTTLLHQIKNDMDFIKDDLIRERKTKTKHRRRNKHRHHHKPSSVTEDLLDQLEEATMSESSDDDAGPRISNVQEIVLDHPPLPKTPANEIVWSTINSPTGKLPSELSSGFSSEDEEDDGSLPPKPELEPDAS